MVVFVVNPVDVEKIGVEPVLVYCDDVEPVGRVCVGVGVEKFGVEPVLVYCDDVEPVGRVCVGVGVEKLGVEPVLVYCVGAPLSRFIGPDRTAPPNKTV